MYLFETRLKLERNANAMNLVHLGVGEIDISIDWYQSNRQTFRDIKNLNLSIYFGIIDTNAGLFTWKTLT